MTAVISTTYDDKYLYFLPITTWLWNKLGVYVICFIPDHSERNNNQGLSETKIENRKKKYYFMLDTCDQLGLKVELKKFSSPEHKEATYAQCSRLYGACLDLPEDEVLVTSDIDMGVFRTNFMSKTAYDFFDVYGTDLVPDGQLPMCYAVADAKTWRRFFTKGRSYQECLDAELAHEECENMRGNLWCRDQELLCKGVGELYFKHNRSNGQNQFAQNRYDRDDSYILDRLNPDTIDFHMNRPGFEDGNFNIILTILRYHYPQEDFTWLIDYTNAYKSLL